MGEAQSLTSLRALTRDPIGLAYAGCYIPTSQNDLFYVLGCIKHGAAVLTNRPPRSIPMSDNCIARTPNSRVAPGGGGPTRTSKGPRGESLASFV